MPSRLSFTYAVTSSCGVRKTCTFSHFQDMPLRGNMLFNLNANRRGQGNAISDIVLTYNWPHVDILVQSDIQHDGFLDSFSMLFSAKHPGDLNSIVFKKDESVRNLLIQLEDIITSRAVSSLISAVTMSFEFKILHANPWASFYILFMEEFFLSFCSYDFC